MSDELLERAARVLADAMGDNFDHAFTSKSEWNAARGEKGGRYRDINEPMQHDYIDGVRAVIETIREPTQAMLAAAVPYPAHLEAGRSEVFARNMLAATEAERLTAGTTWRDIVDEILQMQGRR